MLAYAFPIHTVFSSLSDCDAGMDQLIGKVEVPGSFSPYRQGGEGYDMVG